MGRLHVILLILSSFSELWAYKNMSVDNHHVCSGVTKRILKLGSGTDSAIIITQNRLSDHTIDWTKDYKCSFEVKAGNIISHFLDEPIGIFAVIQSMNLRRNPHTHECFDYIQFKGSNGKTSPRLCGELDAKHAMDSKFADSSEEDDDFFGFANEVPILTYDEPLGSLSVYLFIKATPLKHGEDTDFMLAFTAYKHCRNSDYKKCDDDESKCIYQSFFKDGIVNCPYYDCVDEDGCKPVKVLDVDKPLSIGSHILIGSATSLVVSFVVFVLCLYLCRKYSKFCWSDGFSRPPPNVRPPSTQSNAQAAPNATDTVTLHAPSAPVATPDKDMPPSYASLFPLR